MNSFLYKLLLFSLVGCASFYQTERVTEKIFSPLKTLSLSVSLVDLDYKENDKNVDKEDYNEVKQDSLKKIKEVFQDNPKFNLVDVDSPKKDIIIEVELRKKYESSLTMQIVSGMTLYLIPRRSSEDILYTARFYDSKRNLLGVVELSDQLVTWRHILLIPFWPFMSSYHQSFLTIVKTMTQNALEMAVKDYYFTTIN